MSKARTHNLLISHSWSHSDRMTPCDVILIFAGKYATYSRWIQREIRIAKKDYDKPVVAIRPRGSAQVSSVVAKAADRLVGWETDSIVSAIREVTL
jgi:hypothetical protein